MAIAIVWRNMWDQSGIVKTLSLNILAAGVFTFGLNYLNMAFIHHILWLETDRGDDLGFYAFLAIGVFAVRSVVCPN